MDECFGATPSVVPAGEIYTLQQSKGVDPNEWGLPTVNMPESFDAAAKYIIMANSIS